MSKALWSVGNPPSQGISKKKKKNSLHGVKNEVKPYREHKASQMSKTQNKRTFLGISGLSPKAIEALRARARDNNRSVSGELRAIIRAELSQAETPASENTEQT